MAANIYTTLFEGKLVDAITMLRPKIEGLGVWQLNEELEQVAETYRSMLQYLLSGAEDPEGPAMKQKLIRQAYAINDRANRIIRLRKKKEEQYCQAESRESGSVADDTYASAVVPGATKDRRAEKEQIERHDNWLKAAFEQCWTSDLWNGNDETRYRTLFASETTSDSDKAVLTSAVTLALLEMFDEKKLMFLFDAYEDQSTEVSQRALTGIVLMLIRYDGRLKFYTDITSRFSLNCESDQFRQECFTILMQLEYSKLTDTVTAKMVHDIMPAIVSNIKSAPNRADNNDLPETLIANGENPEWLFEGKDGKKAQKKIQQMGDMQKEGADVYMSSFCHLKSFAFFGSLHRWFLPFSYFQPYAIDIHNELRPEVARLMNLMLNNSPFCNSDKYSFAFMVGGIGEAGQDTLMQQIEGQMGDDFKNGLDALTQTEDIAQTKSWNREKEAGKISRNYIFDLYRVFNAYPYHHQLFNPFDKKFSHFTPLHIVSFGPLTKDYDNMLALAEFFMRRGQYADAKDMFVSLNPQMRESDADIWQKIGFCQQKLNEPEALDTYKTAFCLQPESKWTIQHIAQTAFDKEDYDTAIEYYDMMLADDADNLKLIMRKAEAMFAKEQYKEALPLLYKVNYIDENLRKGKEMLAWGLFMTKNFDKAETLYRDLAKDEEAVTLDTINLAHLLYAKGEVQKAMKLYAKAYQQYMKEATTEKFIEDFWHFGIFLKNVGVDEGRLAIVADAVRV